MFLEVEPVPATAGWLSLLVSFGIMFLVFYFFLLRPQQQQEKKRQEMLGSLKKGNKVVTLGGIHGEITAIKDDVVTLKVAENVEIKITRSGIASVAK
ncbi:MAG: preprotein translocase subunit YajC [Firmicutes bacterium]|nr:preprotein translocase subunit YajC [Bacillota bacterium]